MAATPSAAPLRLHSRVAVTRIGYGTVLFVGQTSFAPGLWVGIALDPGTPGGKNDGSVQGKRYFDVEPGMGVFVRNSQVTVVGGPEDFEDDDEGEPDFENGRFDDEYDNDEYDYEEALMATQPTPPPQARPRPSSVQQQQPQPRTPALRRALTGTSAATTPAPATARRGLAPPSTTAPRTRTSSPEKPAAMTARTPGTTSRPSLASRSSVASSSASSSTTGAGGRRSLASSPAKVVRPAGSAAPSPTKRPTLAPPSATRTAVTTPLSGRSSAASSKAARRVVPAATPRASTSASATTATPRAPATSARAVPTPCDRQTTAAQAGLRPVAKARPSMAPSSVRTPATARRPAAGREDPADLDADGSLSNESTPARSAGSHGGPSSSAPLSPSADAQRRLQAARAKMRLSGGGGGGGVGGEIIDDNADFESDEDLLGMSLDQAAAASSSTSTSTRPAHPTMSSMELNALKREVEELRVKHRLAEKRREEERARVKELEKWQEENDEKLRIAQGATEKLQSLDGRLLALQTSEKELNLIKADLEERIDDLTEQLEMAALDREVAEEKAEAAVTESEQLKQHNEELQLEVDVLREENALYEGAEGGGAVDTSERSSTAWIQLEKQNERLKEALIRLRDVTSETDLEQRRRISELDKELSALADVQDSRDVLASKLQSVEAQLDDVKIQLDDALGAEEMLEQLTERNLFLGERMAEMGNTIEELESLKELNEELEEVHIETEKQMQEEIDLKDMTLRERQSRVEHLEANLSEYEGTFAQFRELVVSLQSDIEALRTEREGLVAESQNASLNSQSREMLNLNLKLQSSALKSQARTIDVELSKMRADQAALHLAMIKPYLPLPFVEQGDRDAVEGVLFFKRMSGKSDLIRSVIESNRDVGRILEGSGEDGSAAGTGVALPDHLVGVCQLRHSLAHFSAVCSSTAAMLRQAPPGTFLKCGRIYKEMQAAVESRVDAFVDALRKEELKEEACNAEFKRFVRQFEELNYALMLSQEEEHAAQAKEGNATVTSATDGDLAAKEVGSAMLLDLDLDTLSAALLSVRQTVEGVANGGGGDALADWSRFFAPLQQLLADLRATKVLARKLQRRLSNLASNDEAVSMDAIGDLPSLGRMSSRMVAFASGLAAGVDALRSRDDTGGVEAASTEGAAPAAGLDLQSVLDVVRNAARELGDDGGGGAESSSTTTTSPAPSSPWSLALSTSEHLAKTISGLISAATEQANVVSVVTGASPWVPRSSAVHTLASHNAEMERSMLKLQDDLRDLYHQIKARDAALSESAIKMERLQKSLEKSKGQDAEQAAVREKLNEVRAQAKAYQDANESLQAELDAAEKTSEELRAQVARAAVSSTVSSSNGNDAGGAQGSSAAAAAADTQTASGFAATANAILHGSRGGAAHTLETHHLLDQLDAMRALIRHLRSKNSLLLYSRDGVSGDALAMPALVHRGLRNDGAQEDVEAFAAASQQAVSLLQGIPHRARVSSDLPRREDLRTVQGERRALFESLLSVAAQPRVVTLSKSVGGGVEAKAKTDDVGAQITTKTETEATTASSSSSSPPPRTRTWQRARDRPAGQYDEQITRIEEMMARFEKLQSRQRAQTNNVMSNGVRQPQRRGIRAWDARQLPVVHSLTA